MTKWPHLHDENDLQGALRMSQSHYIRAFESDHWLPLILSQEATQAFQEIGDRREKKLQPRIAWVRLRVSLAIPNTVSKRFERHAGRSFRALCSESPLHQQHRHRRSVRFADGQGDKLFPAEAGEAFG